MQFLLALSLMGGTRVELVTPSVSNCPAGVFALASIGRGLHRLVVTLPTIKI